MGQLHRTCVETWLSASNSDSCEICKFHYVTERKPKPFIEVRNLFLFKSAVY